MSNKIDFYNTYTSDFSDNKVKNEYESLPTRKMKMKFDYCILVQFHISFIAICCNYGCVARQFAKKSHGSKRKLPWLMICDLFILHISSQGLDDKVSISIKFQSRI